jgi:hypothetical protein
MRGAIRRMAELRVVMIDARWVSRESLGLSPLQACACWVAGSNTSALERLHRLANAPDTLPVISVIRTAHGVLLIDRPASESKPIPWLPDVLWLGRDERIDAHCLLPTLRVLDAPVEWLRAALLARGQRGVAAFIDSGRTFVVPLTQQQPLTLQLIQRLSSLPASAE